LPPTQPPLSYTSFPTSQQTTEKIVPDATRVDLSHLERQRVELEQREKRLMERERELRTSQIGRKFIL
jgi:hypothetical protein